jgi:ketosteroid isomerase-like protein
MTIITSELATLRTAIESRDAEAVTAHYASDATLPVLDAEHPPSRPAVYRGLSEINAYYRDVCGRNIDHHVDDVITDGDRFSFVQHCR